jgi:hypothetical protein
MHVVMAWLAEMQAMVTVWAGMRSENPAPRAASRATLLVFTSYNGKKFRYDSLQLLQLSFYSFFNVTGKVAQ